MVVKKIYLWYNTSCQNETGGNKMIGWIAWVLIGLTLLVGIALIIIVMMQSSKEGSSAAYGNNTFYGSNKGKTLDGVLSKLTVFLGIAFIVLCFVTTIAVTK